MTNEAREARRAYKREWCKRNPDKVKKHTADYWERKAAKAKQEHDEESAEREGTEDEENN